MVNLVHSVRLKLLGMIFCTIIHEDNTKKRKKAMFAKGIACNNFMVLSISFFSLYLYDNDSQQYYQPTYLNSYFNLNVCLSLLRVASVKLSNFQFLQSYHKMALIKVA